MAVYRPSTGAWIATNSSTKLPTYFTNVWGASTDTPVPGDFDGDGKADLAVFRPSTGTWYILKSSTGFTSWLAPTWGAATDIPIH
jgi:hypothetical protein